MTFLLGTVDSSERREGRFFLEGENWFLRRGVRGQPAA
jgi:hypothetical protein